MIMNVQGETEGSKTGPINGGSLGFRKSLAMSLSHNKNVVHDIPHTWIDKKARPA
jgi:hypothetical protein